jgi:two-component system nitrogen regulation response regulator NtrX
MGEKILVLDDEPLVLMTVERALGKVGYEVRVAGDAGGFLDALRAEKAALLIMDLHLGGTDMEALIEQAMRISPGSQILFMSGSAPERPGNFLEKPFRIDDLRQKVRTMLDAH